MSARSRTRYATAVWSGVASKACGITIALGCILRLDFGDESCGFLSNFCLGLRAGALYLWKMCRVAPNSYRGRHFFLCYLWSLQGRCIPPVNDEFGGAARRSVDAASLALLVLTVP